MVILLLLPLVASTTVSTVSEAVGEYCETNEGWEGSCRLSYECLPLETLEGYKAELCGQGPRICCPDTVPLEPAQDRKIVQRKTKRANVKSHIYVNMFQEGPLLRRPLIRRKPIRTMIRRRKRRPIKKPVLHIGKLTMMPKPYKTQVGKPLIHTKKPLQVSHKPHPGGATSYMYKYGTPESEVIKYNLEAMQDTRLPTKDLPIFPEEAEMYRESSMFQVMFGRPQPNSNPKRISQIKCDEYKTLATETIAELSKFGMIPKKIDKCSITDKEYEISSGIASKSEYPHVAGLGYDDDGETQWLCGGSLISEQYVLTAAHCMHTPLGKPLKVGLGEVRLGGGVGDYQELRISEIAMHPLYNASGRFNDIALVKLAKKVKVVDSVRPACLQAGLTTLTTAVATEWDPIETMSLEIRMKPNLTHRFTDGDEAVGLRKSSFSLLDVDECGIPPDVADSLLCVRTNTPSPSCSSDGGGPLQMRQGYNKCMYNILGIGSMKSCEEPTMAIYTRVAHFLPWIESIVWP